MTANLRYVRSLITPSLSIEIYLHGKKIVRTRLRKEVSAFLLPLFSPYFFGKKDPEISPLLLSWELTYPPCRKVYELLKELVPFGKTITYGEFARRIGLTPRFVGFCMKKNPFPIIVPCHRVIGKKGLGGFSEGAEIKKELLKHEGVS